MSAKRKKTQPKTETVKAAIAQAAALALIQSLSAEQLRALVRAAFPSVVDQPLPEEIVKHLGGKLGEAARKNGEEHLKAAQQKQLADVGLANAGLARKLNNDQLTKRGRAAKWRPIVIETLRKLPFYAVAAKAAGINREYLCQYCTKHPSFRAECEQAMNFAAEAGAAQLWARAFAGNTEPIWSRDAKGNPIKVDERRIFDNKAAIFMLQTHLREKYFLKQVQEITGPGGAALPMVAPTQVQIIIPDNGRDSKPAAVDVTSEVKQITDAEKK